MKIDRKLPLAVTALALAAAAALALRARTPAAESTAAAPAARSAAPAPPARRPSVILVSIDTLRADALGSYGRTGDTSPVLDRLARDGVRFVNAYSTSSWTPPAMASLMTALYPVRHGVTSGRVVRQVENGAARKVIEGQQILPDDLTALAQILQRSGYRTYGITTNAHLEADLGFARGFDRYECLGFAEGPRLLASLDALMPEITASSAPYFLWLHLFDPHSPYFPNRPWLARAADGKLFRELEAVTPPERYRDLGATEGERLEYVKALYHGEVRYSDDAVGRALARLGPTDDALIIVTSDHGEEFLEHGWFGHAHNLHEETVRIPMIVRFPGRRFAGTVIEQPVSLVDVLPTVGAAVGAAVPAELDGRSLLPLIAGTEPASAARPVFAELGRDHPMKMVRAGNHKLIHDVVRPERSALFDLRADPGERTDVSAAGGDRAAQLTQVLREGVGLAAGAERATSSRPLSDREIQALKSMGYVQ